VASSLKSETKALKSWLIDAALPFWAARGMDRRGGFFEDLHLNGRANRQAVRRIRVQSRQIFVYAQAQRLGWYEGAPIADKTYRFLERYGFQTDEGPNKRGGYAHRIGPDYTVVDPLRDFYDHAFHLLGCASLMRLAEAKNSAAAKARAQEILGFIDVELETDHGGWAESQPASLPRRQNPHMHFLEASMALYDATGEARHLMPARLVYALCTRHFFDPKNQVISEFFTQDWQIASGDLGQSAEPGHAAEWVWLLSQFEKRTAIATGPIASALYDKAFIGNPVFLNDEENKQGHVRRATKRLWVQTEVIRAHLAQMERGHPEARARAVRAIAAFREHYLRSDGTWIDQLSGEGMPCAKTIPVSTFYHIMGMIMEADRLS
jgi:mannose-6-phosphate isomerase